MKCVSNKKRRKYRFWQYQYPFCVAQGESLPDNEELEKSDIILSYLKFESEHTNKTSALPIFELTEEKTITVGWVVSFSDICRNIEFKSVRLWSVAE